MLSNRVRNVFFQELIYRFYLPFRKIAQSFGIKSPYVFHPFCFSVRSIQYLLERIGFTSIDISPSPLTKGDPYQYSSVTVITRITKAFVSTISTIIYRLSHGRLITGPSLLVWAEKPKLVSNQ